ncbi:MAG TPA: aminodeoxychorismate lyase [Steroidobacteraceae bacterium]|nr:aminodeoxychorismate lyase [Steroidobacteraceae bacterium]
MSLGPEVVRVDGREAGAVSALDRGLHYGDGLFETIACLGHRPRLLGRHLARLEAGCRRLALATDLAAVAAEVRELAAGSARAIVKVLVTRGAATARGYAPSGTERPTRITLRYAWPEDDARLAQDGVRVRIAATRLGENPALAGLKHCNRLEQVLARAELRGADFAEALMFSSGGRLISGTMSNVFLVHHGRLATPRLDACGVAGVMRATVLEAAAAVGIPAAEGAFGTAELEQAEEIFLTNALIGVRPVRELQGAPRAVGPVTRALQAQLPAVLARDGAHA